MIQYVRSREDEDINKSMLPSQCLASCCLGGQNHRVNSTIAFKEWSLVCDALGSGAQSVILRKGGIHEGRGGFSFDEDQFALFPTLFHEQEKHLRDYSQATATKSPEAEYQPGDEVTIKCWAELSCVWNLNSWQTIKELEPHHIWSRSTIRERFEWSRSPGNPPGIKMALVRVYRLGQPCKIQYQRNHGGCRSWLQLPEMSCDEWQTRNPVLDDEAFAAIRRSVEKIAGLPQHQSGSGLSG